MSVEKRRFCIVAPVDLLNQIEGRGKIHQRSRNREIAYLLEFAFTELDGADPVVEMPAQNAVRTNLYLPSDLIGAIRSQAEINHRAVGTQVVMLLRYAIDRMTQRDLALIEQMVRAGSAAHAPQQTGTA